MKDHECTEQRFLDDVKNHQISIIKAAHDFIYDLPDGEKFEFIDFFDYGSAERFTWHYIWCLYAIVWGIMKYDEAKND